MGEYPEQGADQKGQKLLLWILLYAPCWGGGGFVGGGGGFWWGEGGGWEGGGGGGGGLLGVVGVLWFAASETQLYKVRRHGERAIYQAR